MPSPADAQVAIELYKLRTEEVMRKARSFIALEWWPKTWEEVQEVVSAMGTEKNAYYRQVFSYWEMAAGFVVRGAIDDGVFIEQAGEMLFLYSKYEPFLAKIRETSPTAWKNVEAVINMKKEYKDRVAANKQRLAARK